MSTFLKCLECPKCGKTYPTDEVIQLCSCGSPLLVRYHLDKIKSAIKRSDLVGRIESLWRYKEFLPICKDSNIVTLGEGMTPLIPMGKLGPKLGFGQLLLKDEGIIPTGTFKARGATVGVSKAKELGVKALAMPTNGNAGGAWAAYCASADIDAYIVMPEDAPLINRVESAITGAKLYLIKGLINDAGKTVGRAVSKYGWYDASTLKEPYRIEGKKTMGLEIAEQLGWRVPDVILYPTGGGVGLIGIYKALLELQETGWMDSAKMPRLVSVQASGCAPIVKAWEQKKTSSELWPNSETVAFGINVPKAIGDFLVLDAIYKTEGCAIAVDDEAILAAQAMLARAEGIFACPEGASTLAAAMKLREDGWINDNDEVLLLNTGTGLKYPDSASFDLPLLEKDEDL